MWNRVSSEADCWCGSGALDVRREKRWYQRRSVEVWVTASSK